MVDSESSILSSLISTFRIFSLSSSSIFIFAGSWAAGRHPENDGPCYTHFPWPISMSPGALVPQMYQFYCQVRMIIIIRMYMYNRMCVCVHIYMDHSSKKTSSSSYFNNIMWWLLLFIIQIDKSIMCIHINVHLHWHTHTDIHTWSQILHLPIYISIIIIIYKWNGNKWKKRSWMRAKKKIISV